MTADDDRERRIRERAHRIWEAEGRPDDRDRVHWEIAARIIDEEDATGDSRSEAGVDEAVEETFPASDPPAFMGSTSKGITADPEALAEAGNPVRKTGT